MIFATISDFYSLQKIIFTMHFYIDKMIPYGNIEANKPDKIFHESHEVDLKFETWIPDQVRNDSAGRWLPKHYGSCFGGMAYNERRII